MSRVKVRYFVAKKQKGHTLYYWQPTPKMIAAGYSTRRLAESSNDLGEAIKQAEALNRQYDAWRGGKDAVPNRAGTIPWLISKYMEDEAFTNLSERAQKGYLYRLRYVEAWSERAGHPPIRSITRKIAKTFYKALKNGQFVIPKLSKRGAPVKDPEAAAQRLSGDVIGMCRVLWHFALDEGDVEDNPFVSMRTKGSPPRQQVWTDEQIEAVVAAAERTQRKTSVDGRQAEYMAVQQRAAIAAELAETLPSIREAREAASQELLEALARRGVGAQLQREHDISPGALSHWRSGHNTPSKAMLERLLPDHAPLPTGGKAEQAAEMTGVSPKVVRRAIKRLRTDPEAHERAKAGINVRECSGETYRSVGLAVAIAANTAQRQGDILRMTWSQYNGSMIRLRQHKTKAFLDIPVTDDLKAVLDAAPRLSPLMVVNEETGKPWVSGSFTRAFRDIRRAAGLPDDLQFRDLRRTATVRLAEAGCSPPLIAAIGGWSMTSLNKMLDIYMPRNTAMAREAITKLEEYRRTQRERKLEG